MVSPLDPLLEYFFAAFSVFAWYVCVCVCVCVSMYLLLCLLHDETNTPTHTHTHSHTHTPTVGMPLTTCVLKGLELMRLAPTGTSKVQTMLQQGAIGLAKGGELGIFTPMYLCVGRKPLSSSGGVAGGVVPPAAAAAVGAKRR